jgi:putative SOS response-associated peptidase YedK
MCGRYIIRLQAEALREWERYGLPPFPDSYNVAPTQAVPIVRIRGAMPEGAMVRWGLVPYFTHGEPPAYATINARVESFERTPSYRGPWQRGQRCIQLASGFYEWHLDSSGRKHPYFISVADQELFGFAGLWDRSVKPDGTEVESCVLLTLPANELMTDIHNGGSHPHRMPAILRAEDREAWLRGSPAQARAALKPYPASLMLAYEVSPRVNSAKNDSPDLIEPIQRGPTERAEPAARRA